MATAYSYRSKDNSSSESDSEDSDKERNDWKRASRKTNDVPNDNFEKIPIPPMQTETQTAMVTNSQGQKRKKNNIWSDVLEDQMISETLTQVGLKQKPLGYGERGAESYDYTLAKKFYQNSQSDNMSEDEENSKESETKRISSHNPKLSFKKEKKPNQVKLDGAEADAAQKIIKVLNEKKHYLIFRIVKYLGIEKSFELLKKTEEIEENGGMMIKNNSRKRTPGGIFLTLMKADSSISQKVQDKIFEGEMNSYEMKRMFDEKKKQRKLAKEKRKMLAKLNQVQQSIVQLPVPKVEDEEKPSSQTPMEAEMEDAPTPIKRSDSDLEDGEIDD